LASQLHALNVSLSSSGTLPGGSALGGGVSVKSVKSSPRNPSNSALVRIRCGSGSATEGREIVSATASTAAPTHRPFINDILTLTAAEGQRSPRSEDRSKLEPEEVALEPVLDRQLGHPLHFDAAVGAAAELHRVRGQRSGAGGAGLELAEHRARPAVAGELLVPEAARADAEEAVPEGEAPGQRQVGMELVAAQVVGGLVPGV